MASPLDEGISLHRQGRLAEAEALYRAVLSKSPDDAGALHYLGLVKYQEGQLETADAFMRRSLILDRSCANTWNDLGAVKLKADQVEESIRHFTHALELNAQHLDALSNMATAMRRLFRFESALVPLRRLVLLRPRSSDVARMLADTLYHVGAIAESIESFREAIRLDPQSNAARFGLAEACEAAGKFKQARWQYTAVLRRDPTNAVALSKLLQMRDAPTEPDWVARAEQLAERDATETGDRLNIGLAYYFDRVGSYDVAFRHLKRARGRQAREQRFNSNAYAAAVDTLIEVFDREFFDSRRTFGVSSARPIFIVGMPRSGTTLTEQVLATHPRVAAGGELLSLPRASYRVLELSSEHRPYPAGLRSLSRASIEELAKGYLDQLEKIDSEGRRVTDKLPFNFMHLGILALLLPEATIVHCRRHPLDNCLSCYFTNFAGEVQFSNDLVALGRYYADYHRLMKHWQAVLPIKMFELRYEDLVIDTEAAVRGLLAHCGLEWDPACLQFHQTGRGIQTPSRWQVRQPIYRNSLARWRHYERQLEPLKQGLGHDLLDENDEIGVSHT